MTEMFTRAELLEQWLTRRGYQPLRADVVTDLTTGTHLAAHLGREVADWVRHIYASAPAELLPVTEGASLCRLVANEETDGAVRLIMPADAARVVAVRLSGWSRAVAPSLPGCPDDTGALNPFIRPDATHPLAVVEPSGSMLLRPAAGCSVESFLYVPCAPADNEPVSFDPILLSTMSSFNPDRFNPLQPQP